MDVRLQISLAAALMFAAGGVHAADTALGKTVSQAQCSQCHEPDDWEGESAKALESLIRDIAAGKVKHKTPIDLTGEQIAAIAAYWAQASKGK